MNPIEKEDKNNQAIPSSIKVIIKKAKSSKPEYIFSGQFQIGRSLECDIQIAEESVSRFHAKVTFKNGEWWIFDLQSNNGLWINGEKIEKALLKNNLNVELGYNGPLLVFYIDDTNPTIAKLVCKDKKSPDVLSTKQYEARYFSASPAENIGQHTMMLRRAYQKVQKKQKRLFSGIILVVLFLFFVAGSYAIKKHLEIRKQKQLAEDIFYSMKSLELELSIFLAEVSKSPDKKLQQNINSYRSRLKEMKKNYDQFVTSLKIYEENTDAKEILILKTAQAFGECEINIPDDFRNEVLKYIEKWKSSSKLKNSIKQAGKKGYIPEIVKTMKKYDLPLQFIYLAVQESNLNVNACGPKTRYGIAKGAWQFIPSTAKVYGLKIGPLKNRPIPDAKDERHHFLKSTECAGKYIRDIYNTDAQASGLLVMASYNWGQGRVINLIKKMPQNPKERNFWCFLKKHKKQIPKETYDYVFYIFSAAVIGENPRLFGFDFDNPLA